MRGGRGGRERPGGGSLRGAAGSRRHASLRGGSLRSVAEEEEGPMRQWGEWGALLYSDPHLK